MYICKKQLGHLVPSGILHRVVHFDSNAAAESANDDSMKIMRLLKSADRDAVTHVPHGLATASRNAAGDAFSRGMATASAHEKCAAVGRFLADVWSLALRVANFWRVGLAGR